MRFNVTVLVLGVTFGCSTPNSDPCSSSSAGGAGQQKLSCSATTTDPAKDKPVDFRSAQKVALCTYDEGMGCLKANISEVDLRAGDFVDFDRD